MLIASVKNSKLVLKQCKYSDIRLFIAMLHAIL